MDDDPEHEVENTILYDNISYSLFKNKISLFHVICSCYSILICKRINSTSDGEVLSGRRNRQVETCRTMKGNLVNGALLTFVY